MKKVFTGIGVLVLVLFLASSVFGADNIAKTIGITQANVKPDAIQVYLDVYNAGGENVEEVGKDGISATLGGKKLAVNDLKRFDSAGEPAAYLFLVDISKSLDKGQTSKMKQVLNEILGKTNKDDKIAITTFGDDVNTLQDFTADKDALKKQIDSIVIKDNNTNLYKGVSKALEMLAVKNAGIPDKRALVIVSDGEESHDAGITKDEVYMKIKETHIPIFTVAFYNQGSSEKNKEYEKVLGSFARTSFGQDYLLGMGDVTVSTIAQSFQSRINKSFVLKLDRSGIKADGQSYYLKVSLEQKDIGALENGLDIRIDVPEASPNPGASPSPGTSKPKPKKGLVDLLLDNLLLVVIGAVVLAIIVAVLIAFALEKRRQKAEEGTEVPPDFSAEEEGGNMDYGKTGAIGANGGDFIDKTKPLAGEPNVPAKKGVPVRLIKLGRQGDEKVYDVNLCDSVIIGRDPSKAKLVFKDDEKLSGRHCELTVKDGMIFVLDLKSTNGTFVNGVPIDGYYRLRNDDILLIGSMELRVGIKE